MKKSQMILSAMALMAVVKSNAESSMPNNRVKCSVEVIADICGSGEVAIEFYQGNFVLNYGDVHCWFGDFNLSGKMLSSRVDHTGMVVKVDLFRGQNNGSDLVGHLTYRSARANSPPLATLETKNLESRGGKSSIYHLQCNELPTGLDCYETCKAEGKNFQECHSQCGGW